MRVEVESVTHLRFQDGTSVRAASGLAPLGDGWLVVQDDSTLAAWWRDGVVEPVRLLPPVEGLDVFDQAGGTKHLKPDLEAACALPGTFGPGVVVLGSGSSPARRRGVLVQAQRDGISTRVADLAPLYAAAVDRLGISEPELNLEGACVVGGALRWFQRGRPAAGSPTGSVDVDLAELLAVLDGTADPQAVAVGAPRTYDLGTVRGVGLAVTDAVTLTDGAVLLSAAAEDAPNVVDDGPVVGSALVLLQGDRMVGQVELPLVGGAVCKVEGLALVEHTTSEASVLATVDADDPHAASLALRLRVHW